MKKARRQILLAAALAVTVGLVPIGRMLAAGLPASQAATQTARPAPQTAKPATPAPSAAPQSTAAAVDPKVTTPKQEWGHNVGDDYFLANYQQLIAYWNKLAKESNRIHVTEIGKTAEGRPQLMATITSPENYAKIDRYKSISRQLSLGEDPTGRPLTDAQAQALAKEGKSVVSIDGGLHATEVLGAQQLLETVYQLTALQDEETKRFLNDVIVLCVPANPDGMDLVSDSYMKRGSTNTPVLYNHYAGHDDNRDSYMNALPETTNVSKVMYREWFPQIMYNHHQTGPAGAVMFAPPFRDPFNYNFHPNIPAAMDIIGAVISTRAIMEGKPGVVNRNGANYSTWWNGGFRTVAYFHNQLGILTETIGNPTPIQPEFNTRYAIGNMSNWFPLNPGNWTSNDGRWHFRQSIEYSITANRAILDFASRYRESNLYRIYQMGRDEVKWGSEDHWTFTPHKTAKVEQAACGTWTVPTAANPAPAARAGGGAGAGGRGAGGGGGRGGAGCTALYAALTAKDQRDPRGFIMPSSQPDFGSAVRFVNALIKSGITVHRATTAFTVAGKQYPANSLIVKTAQPFRPHVMDMFEPQDHPDDIPYPGATPTRPYDNAGYTLAFQMGVQFDRILDGFDGPFEKLTDLAKVPAGQIKTGGTAGYYFSHESTNSFIAINRLLNAGEDVSWLATGPKGTGTFYVAAKPTTAAILQKAATDLGVSFDAASSAPTGTMSHLKKLRIGLVDNYGGSMPVGWTRLIFKDFEFPFVEDSANDVFAPDINAGSLHAKYDVLVFNNIGMGGGGGGRGGRGGGGGAGAEPPAGSDAPPAAAAQAGGGRGGGRGGGAGEQAQDPADFRKRPFEALPEKYAKRQGQISAEGVAALKQFVQDGGTIVAIGSAATSAIATFGLPLEDHVTAAATEYYVPGSVLRISLDPKNPVAHGYGDQTDIFFDNSPVWRLKGAGDANLKVVGWFNSPEPLRSGWAWGQRFLDKGIQIAEASVGKGHVILFGNQLLFRSQPHGNFKLFFNSLYLSVAPELKAGAQ